MDIHERYMKHAGKGRNIYNKNMKSAGQRKTNAGEMQEKA